MLILASTSEMKSSNLVDKVNLEQLESAEEKVTVEKVLTNKEKDSSIIDVLIKSVPDILALDATIEREYADSGSLNLHLYAVRTFCSTPSSEARVHTCPSCQPNLKGMNSLGLALLRPIPQEVLDCDCNATLRSAEQLIIRYEYLGEKVVKDNEVYQMQRFHKGNHLT